MRDYILDQIRQLAAVHGQAPGQKLFASETGIAQHQWRGRFWSRWGDALIEAGFEPNEWTSRRQTSDLLKGLITACRHYGRLPTYSEIQMLRRSDPTVPSPKVVSGHFGNHTAMVIALRQHCELDQTLSDLAALLPELSAIPDRPRPKSKDGFVYLIKSGEYFKIGRSDDAERRFKQISVTLPERAELFHTIRTDDPPGIEAYWHRRFSDRRANGEWFKLSTQDVSAFKKRTFQ